MAQRRGGKVLLEMMQSGSAEPVRDPRAGAERWGKPRREKRERPRREPRVASSDEAPAWFTWFGGARSVRIPIGYLFVAAALALALTIVGYLVGFNRAEARLDALRRAEAARSVDKVVSDPLLADLPVNPSLLSGGTTAATNERPVESNLGSGLGAPPPSQPVSADAAQGAPTIGDPRQAGMNYYIVAREHPQEAERVATYLRGNGIDALVIDDRVAPWRLVVALRGFPSGTLSSTEAQEYRSRLHSLGRAWKRDHRGTTDFSDAYAQRYSG